MAHQHLIASDATIRAVKPGHPRDRLNDSSGLHLKLFVKGDLDACVIDDSEYFVRGCLEIPVQGESEPLSWGVWVSLSEKSFRQWVNCYRTEKRSHIGPFFGWLNAAIEPYPDTMDLKTHVHLRDGFVRPFIELEPTDHPLAVEQREGISVARVAELYARVVHRNVAD
jgi:hypothetical protein